jgi:uncharacterized protein HemX
MDDKKAFKMVRTQSIVLGIALIMACSFFFYGMNQEKKNRELAAQTKIQLKECGKRSEEQNQLLLLSLQEARKAKEYALEQSKAAEELSKKRTSNK